MSMMQVWTIQTLLAWDKFKATGVLHADERFIDPDFLAAYGWVIRHLQAHTCEPPPKVSYPIWVWYQWENAQQRRPNLRQKGHLPHGEQGVLLDCVLPTETVLLSDFVLWHHVLNNRYLACNEADEQLFQTECALPNVNIANVCRMRKEQSWERIFDLNAFPLDVEYAAPRAEKSIQGVTWEVHLEQVKSVREFTAR